MKNILKVENLSKSFGGLKAIRDLTTEAREGSITAIIGPNGAGKTTLFNLISALLKPDFGKIIFKDRRIDTLKPHEIPYLGIARTFQNLRVFPNMNVLENIMMGRYILSSSGFLSCALYRRRYRREDREIEEKANFWLQYMNIENLGAKRIQELPFEKQRIVEITRAVSTEPDLILLDEPAAGLNMSETKNLIDTIYKIKELGVTILIVEHDIDLVMEISDKIIVLNFGEKIKEGSPGDVQTDERVISVYLGSKLQETPEEKL